MIDIQLGFLLEPRGKGSVRVGKHAFIDAKSRHFMNEIKRQAKLQFKGPLIPRGVFFHVEVEFNFTRPKKPTHPCQYRPDIDNLQKGLFDALTGVLWHDDGFIQSVNASKQYAPPGNPGFIKIHIRPASHGFADSD